MEVDESAAPTKQGDPKVGELAQGEVPEASATAGAPQDGSAQQAPEADEQVSDTDNDEGEQDLDLVLYPCG